MGKTNGRYQGNNEKQLVAATTTHHRVKKRQRPQVEVIVCPSSFPTSSTKKARRSSNDRSLSDEGTTRTSTHSKNQRLLDWNKTAEEVRSLGATAFVGQQKRSYQDEQYKLLTNREKKQQRVPLPIVRGIKKKAAIRQARQLQEAKEAGLVIPKQQKAKKKNDNATNKWNVHGPAPSIGFVSKGMLKLKGKPK